LARGSRDISAAVAGGPELGGRPAGQRGRRRDPATVISGGGGLWQRARGRPCRVCTEIARSCRRVTTCRPLLLLLLFHASVSGRPIVAKDAGRRRCWPWRCRFSPRDTVLARVLVVALSVSVSTLESVFSPNGWTDRTSFGLGGFFLPILRSVVIIFRYLHKGCALEPCLKLRTWKISPRHIDRRSALPT